MMTSSISIVDLSRCILIISVAFQPSMATRISSKKGGSSSSGDPRDPRWLDETFDNSMNSSVIQMIYVQNMEATLSCANNLRPRPTIAWLKNGRSFTGRPMGKINFIPKEGKLKMTGLLAAYDKGNYTCIVNNSNARLTRTFIIDIVIQHRGPPEFTMVPENRTIHEGDETELNCRYLSGAATYVEWVKHYQVNGSYVDKRGVAYTTVIQRGASSESDPGQLLLANATVVDSGWYTCIVSNQHGSVNRSAWLQVLPPPPAPSPSPLVATDFFSSHGAAFVGAVAAVFVLLMVAMVTVVVYFRVVRRRRQRQIDIPWAKNTLYDGLMTPGGEPVDSEWELNRRNIHIGELIGQGAFGKVYKGYATEMTNRGGESVVVAIKMLQEDATAQEHEELLLEIETMKTIGQHINVISFLGCCTQDGPLQVVVEFAAHGNLREYLQKNRPPSGSVDQPPESPSATSSLSPKDLISFSYQVARGMEYLASRKIIHRDLAARNVLVSEELVLKIADFGLTRDTKEKDYYRRLTHGRLPVKWMAIESLTQNRYTTKSDVWSFGILLWEIFSFGDAPYPALPVENLLTMLNDGRRMEKPAEATDDVYELMKRCWLLNPVERPEFSELVLRLDEMLAQFVNVDYLDLDSASDAGEEAPHHEAAATDVEDHSAYLGCEQLFHSSEELTTLVCSSVSSSSSSSSSSTSSSSATRRPSVEYEPLSSDSQYMSQSSNSLSSCSKGVGARRSSSETFRRLSAALGNVDRVCDDDGVVVTEV